MGFRPSLISLPRLLFGAALVILGFFLASSTQAHADDLGLVKTLETVVDTATDGTTPTDSSSTPIAKIVEEPTKVVTDVTKAVAPAITTQPEVLKPVVDPVTTSVKKVVAATTSVTSQATSLVTKTTAEVTNTTATFVRAVEPLLPATVAVIEPIVEVVEGVVPVADSAPVPVVPIPIADAGGLVGPDTVADPLDVGAGSAINSEQARTSRPGSATASGFLSSFDLVVSTTSAPTSDSTPSPNHPGAPGRAPALPVGGALPGAGSTGGSGPSGADVATPPAFLVVPEVLSAAVLSMAARPHSGPSLDPGSRPD